MDETTCQVWWAAPGLARSWHESLLTAAESDRMIRLRRQEDRDRLVVGNALLRLTIAQTLGCPVQEIRLDRTCPDCAKPHGKPTVVGYPLHVSVSHSGDRVAVAITPAAQVGIDVEQIDSRVPVADLLPSVLAPGEDPDDLPFFTRWARKEAVLKATGEGLRTPMSRVVLASLGRPCVVRDLSPGAGYAAAVAILAGEPLTVTEHDGSRLLDSRGEPGAVTEHDGSRLLDGGGEA